MNNEPVAWRTHYPSGWEYKDGNPPFELKGNSQLLYTHPAKTEDEPNWKEMYWEMHELNHKHWSELKAHPAKTLTDEELVAHVPLMAWEVFSSSLFMLEDNEITNDEFIKRCYEVVKARCNHPQPDYTQFNTQVHPFKTLTDEEIKHFIYPQFVFEDGGIGMPLDEFLATVRAILRKAQK